MNNRGKTFKYMFLPVFFDFFARFPPFFPSFASLTAMAAASLSLSSPSVVTMTLLRLLTDSSAFDCCRLRLVDFDFAGAGVRAAAFRLAARWSRALFATAAVGGGDGDGDGDGDADMVVVGKEGGRGRA